MQKQKLAKTNIPICTRNTIVIRRLHRPDHRPLCHSLVRSAQYSAKLSEIITAHVIQNLSKMKKYFQHHSKSSSLQSSRHGGAGATMVNCLHFAHLVLYFCSCSQLDLKLSKLHINPDQLTPNF